MSGRYTDNDILEEIGNITPTEVALERIGPYVLGGTYLKGIRSVVSDLVTSDPDSFFSLLKQSSDKIVFDIASVRGGLYEIFTLLGSAKGEDSFVSEQLLGEVITGFEELKVGPLVSRRRKLRILKGKIKNLIETSVRGNSSGGSFMALKDPNEARTRIRQVLSSSALSVDSIRNIHTNFSSAIASFFNSGIFLDSIDIQVDSVTERLDMFIGSGGRNISKALLASTVGLALVDERATIRFPTQYKYRGIATIIPGEPASIIGDVSLPLWGPSVESPLLVNGIWGTLNIEKGGAPELNHFINPGIFKVPTTPLPTYLQGRYPAPFTLQPSGQPVTSPELTSTLKLILNNEVIQVYFDSPFYDHAQLADGLNDALQDFDIQVTSESGGVLFTVQDRATADKLTLGSGCRLAFFDQADPNKPLQDLNVILGLTHQKYGDILGVDTTLSGISAAIFMEMDMLEEGFSDFELPPIDPVITSTEQEVLRTSISQWTDDFNFELQAGHGLAVNDTMLVDSGGPRSFYRVVAIEGVDSNSDKITLDREILYSFDGENLSLLELDVIFYRDYVILTSPDNTWGTTEIKASLGSVGLWAPSTEEVINQPMLNYDFISCDPVDQTGEVKITYTTSEVITGFYIELDVNSGASILNMHSFLSGDWLLQTNAAGNILVGLDPTGVGITGAGPICKLTVNPCHALSHFSDKFPFVEKVAGEVMFPSVTDATGDIDHNNLLSLTDLVLAMNKLLTGAPVQSEMDFSGKGGVENLVGWVDHVLNASPLGYSNLLSDYTKSPPSYTVLSPTIVEFGSEGYHNIITLDGPTELGSPLRVGDVVYVNDSVEKLLGTISGFVNSQIVLSLTTGTEKLTGSNTYKTLGTPFASLSIGKDIQIYSLGHHSYRRLRPALTNITKMFADLPSPEKLTTMFNHYMLSSSSRSLIDKVILNYLEVLYYCASIYLNFDANMTSGTVKLMSKTREKRLDSVRRSLVQLDFTGLAKATPETLSAVEHMDSLLRATVDSLQGEGGVAILDEPEQVTKFGVKATNLYEDFEEITLDYQLEYTVEEED